ncbi:MAG: OmpA family protein [Treponemataceae bacterium]|nr:OmpA family protein [Treponemataceae bacterium]
MQKRRSFLYWIKVSLFCFVLSFNLFSQNQGTSSSHDPLPMPSTTMGVVLSQSFPGPYTLVERSNWARYDNGKYTGHVYRETRYRLDPFQESEAVRYRGTVYVFEETLRDLQKVARPLDDIIPVEFTLSKTGSIRLVDDQGYPLLRNFPIFPEKPLRPGDTWIAPGERIVDPRNDGNRVRLPLLAEYRFLGKESYKGDQVYRIQAQYATRYKVPVNRGDQIAQKEPGSGKSQTNQTSIPRMSPLNQPGGGQSNVGPFTEASGTHIVDILIRVADGRLVLMRDTLDETFLWPDGSSVRYKGFVLSFSESFLPFNRSALLALVAQQLGNPEAQSENRDKTDGSSSANRGIGDVAVGEGNNGGLSRAGRAFEYTETDKKRNTEGIILRAGSDSVTVNESFQLDEGSSGAGTSLYQAGTVDFPAQNIEVAAVPEGIKLTVRDIRFVADSDEVLSSERGRLDLIARAIQSALDATPGQSLILVEGHTAAVGRPAGEQELSVRRAKKIVDELTGRGIPAERCIYKGWGGTRPIADNSTEAGRAQNRRVEITILQ